MLELFQLIPTYGPFPNVVRRSLQKFTLKGSGNRKASRLIFRIFCGLKYLYRLPKGMWKSNLFFSKLVFLFCGLTSTFGSDLANSGTSFSWHSKTQCFVCDATNEACEAQLIVSPIPCSHQRRIFLSLMSLLPSHRDREGYLFFDKKSVVFQRHSYSSRPPLFSQYSKMQNSNFYVRQHN